MKPAAFLQKPMKERLTHWSTLFMLTNIWHIVFNKYLMSLSNRMMSSLWGTYSSLISFSARCRELTPQSLFHAAVPPTSKELWVNFFLHDSHLPIHILRLLTEIRLEAYPRLGELVFNPMVFLSLHSPMEAATWFLPRSCTYKRPGFSSWLPIIAETEPSDSTSIILSLHIWFPVSFLMLCTLNGSGHYLILWVPFLHFDVLKLKNKAPHFQSFR